MPGRLSGKVALVTGGASGIGLCIAQTFASEDGQVAICDIDTAALASATSQLKDRGHQVLGIQCDISKSGQVRDTIDQMTEHFGGLHILVNNAGIRSSITTAEDLSEEEWQRTMDVDLKGAWLCSKYAIPAMRRNHGGSIVMISSISAHVGQPKQGCYNVAKAGIEQLMKCMAIDYAADGIRVNSICPAWVETEMNREQLAQMRENPHQIFAPGLSHSDLLKLHPSGRLGTSQDIAWAAVYLASDEAAWVTGSSLMVDGGYTCQ